MCGCVHEKTKRKPLLTAPLSLSSQEQATQRGTRTRHSIHSLGGADDHCLARVVGGHALLVHCSHTHMPTERSHA